MSLEDKELKSTKSGSDKDLPNSEYEIPISDNFKLNTCLAKVS